MDTQEKSTKTPQIMRNVFGIIMILIYVGMGVLLLCNFFNWMDGAWNWLRWAGGIMFIIYGLWRAYRQFKGIDSNI